MWLRPVTYEDALAVARDMREWDRREIYGCRWTDDPRDLAADCASIGRFVWVAGLDDRPIAVIGAWPCRPGTWSVFCFGTDDFPRIRFSLTRFARRVMMASLLDAGAQRAECYSLDGHVDAQRWLEALGAAREATHPAFAGGETYHSYVWTR